MKKYFNFLLLIISLAAFQAVAQEFIIQENELGFCSVDGTIMTSVAGYTGDGYADTDRGIGKSISWAIAAETAGPCSLSWRYGNGGGSGDRPARVLINGATAIESFSFQHTGEWTNWTDSDTVVVDLNAGVNTIRLEAHSVDGLGNYDYLTVIGEGFSPADCMPDYTLLVSQNDSAAGTISYEPVQNYYNEGTLVTLRAQANPGYFFQSWSGDVSSADSVFTFPMLHNVEVSALFLPVGTTADPDLVGYAAVQDDQGTPYIVTGGSLGETVEANTYEELQQYLSSPEPYVVQVSEHIVGTEDLKVTSHKTLIGLTENAHLQGIELEINGARNVIIKNMKISHVTPADAVVITGECKNIWLDHCELFSDRDHGTEYYDGLLDIKNESAFITISWCKIHDHFKTSLISSGDQAVADSVIRVTYHHNYFYNCGSRLPSIRFGTAHVFNNYYKNCDTAINSRMGACVRVERNYFTHVGTAVMMEYSPERGSVQLIDNYFGTANYSETPACVLEVPYPYDHILDETADLPVLISGEEDTSVPEFVKPTFVCRLENYPNPFNPETTIRFSVNQPTEVKLKIFTVLGQEVATLADAHYPAGEHSVRWDASNVAGGIYFYQLHTGAAVVTRKMVVLK